MLVLSRKAKQHIVIGDHVKVVVVAVQGGRVKLGFSAPANVPIHRGEVHLRRQTENREAPLGPDVCDAVDDSIARKSI